MLVRHHALLNGVGELEQAVGQRRLAVIDVGDNTEVAGKGDVHEVGGKD
jgi:hypothetical protein